LINVSIFENDLQYWFTYGFQSILILMIFEFWMNANMSTAVTGI